MMRSLSLCIIYSAANPTVNLGGASSQGRRLPAEARVYSEASPIVLSGASSQVRGGVRAAA